MAKVIPFIVQNRGEKMEIIKKRIADIVPYENNAKIHTQEQIEQIANSIEEFGFNDPICIDEDNVIIEGHGRLLALQELGYEEVECIQLIGLTEEQKRAYTLIHNKLTMNTGFDIEILNEELAKITSIDMEGFDFIKIEDIDVDDFFTEAEPKEEEPEEEEEIKYPHCGMYFKV